MDLTKFLTPRYITLVSIVFFLAAVSFGYHFSKPGLAEKFQTDIKLASIEKPKGKPRKKPVSRSRRKGGTSRKTSTALTNKTAPKPKPKIDPRIVFTERFKDYVQGDPVPSWGPNLVVLGSRMKYISSQVPGSHFLEYRIDFPKDFSLEFLIVNQVDSYPSPEVNPRLIDSNGDVFLIELIIDPNVFQHKWYIKLPGTQQVKHNVRKKQNNQFRLVYKEGVAKVYMDGKFLLSNSYGTKFSRFVELKAVVSAGAIGYTNFVVKKLASESLKTMHINKQGLQSVAVEKLADKKPVSASPIIRVHLVEAPAWLTGGHDMLYPIYLTMQQKILSDFKGDVATQKKLQELTLSLLGKVLPKGNQKFRLLNKKGDLTIEGVERWVERRVYNDVRN